MTLKNKFSSISILLSFVGLVALSFVDRNIYQDFLQASGKTRALFGVKEILVYYYKYYFVLLGSLALILGVIAHRKNESKQNVIGSILLSIAVFILIFGSVWRLFI